MNLNFTHIKDVCLINRRPWNLESLQKNKYKNISEATTIGQAPSSYMHRNIHIYNTPWIYFGPETVF